MFYRVRKEQKGNHRFGALWQESNDGITWTDVAVGGTGVSIIPGGLVAFACHFTKQYRKIVGVMNVGTGKVFVWIMAQATDKNWALAMRQL